MQDLKKIIELPYKGESGIYETWTFGITIQSGMVDMYISFGGVRQDSVPAHICSDACKWWQGWLD
jgi:hypothetical protein